MGQLVWGLVILTAKPKVVVSTPTQKTSLYNEHDRLFFTLV